MYVPSSFKIDDQGTIAAFVDRYGFATLVSSPASGIMVTHLPVALRTTPTGAVLVGHVARANSHWKVMDGSTESVAIFHGPHGYVSPTWYDSAPAVPTWNYAAVHAHGKPRATDDADFTRELLNELVARYEQGAHGWRMESQPAAFIETLLKAIVSFEMPIDGVEAKFKLGQNRSDEDRANTIAALERSLSPDAAALAAFMRRNETGG